MKQSQKGFVIGQLQKVLPNFLRGKMQKWVSHTVAQAINQLRKFNIPISIDISIKTHQFVNIRQAWVTSRYYLTFQTTFLAKKAKKLAKTSLNVKILECD